VPRSPQLLLLFLPLLSAWRAPASLLPATRAATLAERRSTAVKALQAGNAGGGGMVDGARIGPPPDMPSLLLNNRIVYLGSPLVPQVSQLIIAELLFLQYESQEKPVLMYINSPGTTTSDGQPVAFETEAFAIVDTMNYATSPIHTVLVGKAYGLSAMLLASGEKGERSSLPYGTVMLNQPRSGAQGQASDIALKAREVLDNRRVALEIMSTATGVSMAQLSEDTNRVKYMDAEQAKAYGIIDKIVQKTANINDANKEAVSGISRGLG